jgi:hypothetical protein
MKRVLPGILAAAGLAAILAFPTPAAGQAKERRANASSDLAALFPGTWEGSTPGNSLRLVMWSTASPGRADVFHVSVTVTGKYQDTSVRQQGVFRLENQGRVVYLTYIPHFDPTASGLTTDTLRFTPRELEAACSFDMAPRGDGFGGATSGSTTCARAMRGAIGKWSLEVEPGAIRVRNVQTGETLRFKRTGK